MIHLLLPRRTLVNMEFETVMGPSQERTAIGSEALTLIHNRGLTMIDSNDGFKMRETNVRPSVRVQK